MLKVDPFRCFSEAKKAYQESKTLIQEMCSEAEKHGCGMDLAEAMMSYDFILQAILLSEALEDGVLVPEEIQFTDQLTEYGDVLGLVNDSVSETIKGKLNWKTVQFLEKAEEGKEFLVKIIVFVKTKTTKFVNMVLKMDEMSSAGYLEKLFEKSFAIGFALAGVDGDDLDNETMNEDVEKELTRFYSALKYIFNVE